MTLYQESKLVDIVKPIAKALANGRGWKIEDGKIYYPTYSPMDNRWCQTNPTTDRDCIRWLHIFFNIYGLVPKPCFGCFKIIAIPRTLSELFRMKEVQERMGFPSKCGIEQRTHVGRNYGAYWYGPLGKGIKPARRLLNEVKKAVADEFGDDAPHVFMKRGCTEMERGWGASNEWEYNEQAELTYQLLEAGYGKVEVTMEDPAIKKPFTIQQWIEFAFSIGDESYLEFSKPLASSPVDYTYDNHGLEEEEIEIVGGEDE